LTTYEQIEKKNARNRLYRIVSAVRQYPDRVDPILVDTDLLELLRIAGFAECDLKLDLAWLTDSGATAHQDLGVDL
jgi:hypothetical protein